MKLAYQSNTGLTLIVDHKQQTYEYNTCVGFATIINVGTNKELSRLERACIINGYVEDRAERKNA